jgi:hypothetical protein
MLILIGLLAAGIYAEQFVLLDRDITWDGSNGRITPDWQGPTNWVSPVNYRDGTIHFRLDVTEKPTNWEAKLQICKWDGHETCSRSNTCTFKSTGLKFCKNSPPDWWEKDGTMSDWTVQKKMSIILRGNVDGNGGWAQNGDASYMIGPAIMDHVPIKMHFPAIVVSKGATLNEPAGWNESGATVMVLRAIAENAAQSVRIVNSAGKTVFASKNNIKSVELINARGEIIKSVSAGAKKRVVVNTAHMPRGVSFAKVMHAAGAETRKITIR